ncbi:MAG: SH3 domain-containing protein [Chloroflexi bacterium]|nr:SH3 domain-containing protein [Chloroflexota bacterium]
MHGTDGSGLRLRSGIWSDVISILPEGTQLEVLDSATDSDGGMWYQVSYSGLTGWTYSPFVAPVAEQVASTSPATSTLELAPVEGDIVSGLAAWYGSEYHGQTMASGQIFDMWDPTTAAANLYPMGTWLRVTNTSAGKSIDVQVRDTGGFSYPFVIDLSAGAFSLLADLDEGVLNVEIQRLQ